MERGAGRKARAALVVSVLVGVMVLVTLVAATRHDTDDRALWFGAIGAWLGFIALVLAGLAVYWSEVLAKPKPALAIELLLQGETIYSGPISEGDVPVVGHVVRRHALPVPGRLGDRVLNDGGDGPAYTYEARVHVNNTGRAELRWSMLNILVPLDCRIEPVKVGEATKHFEAKTPFNAELLYPGENERQCWATVAERDFPPGHAFLYSVKVTVPRVGEWPIVAVLDAPKVDRTTARVVAHVSAPEPLGPEMLEGLMRKAAPVEQPGE